MQSYKSRNKVNHCPTFVLKPITLGVSTAGCYICLLFALPKVHQSTCVINMCDADARKLNASSRHPIDLSRANASLGLAWPTELHLHDWPAVCIRRQSSMSMDCGAKYAFPIYPTLIGVAGTP